LKPDFQCFNNALKKDRVEIVLWMTNDLNYIVDQYELRLACHDGAWQCFRLLAAQLRPELQWPRSLVWDHGPWDSATALWWYKQTGLWFIHSFSGAYSVRDEQLAEMILNTNNYYLSETDVEVVIDQEDISTLEKLVSKIFNSTGKHTWMTRHAYYAYVNNKPLSHKYLCQKISELGLYQPL
jgi:hypothetical protein